MWMMKCGCISGVKGLVLGPDKTPIVGAEVTVVGREHSVATTPMGEFWRILLPGRYSIKIEVRMCPDF